MKCETNDLEVPANADFVIEGYIDPTEPLRDEGPFGDHTGYYTLPEPYPVFHVTAITHRKDAVYPATIVGIPPMEDFYIGGASVKLFLPIFKMNFPEIVDIALPAEGVFHNLVFVSIKKTYPMQAYKIMHGLWGMGQMMFTKYIIVVDADVNVHNTSEVLFPLTPTPTRSATASSPKARPTCSTTRRAKSPAAASWASTRRRKFPAKVSNAPGRRSSNWRKRSPRLALHFSHHICQLGRAVKPFCNSVQSRNSIALAKSKNSHRKKRRNRRPTSTAEISDVVTSLSTQTLPTGFSRHAI